MASTGFNLDLFSPSAGSGAPDPAEETPEEEVSTPVETPVESGSATAEPEAEPEAEGDASSEEASAEAADLTPRERAILERFALTQSPRDTPPPAEYQPAAYTPRVGVVSHEEVNAALNGDAEAFVRVLDAVYNQAVQTASQLSAEAILQQLPETVARYSRQQWTMKETIDNFYQTNADLVQVKPIVAAVANRIAEEHPDYPITKLFQETATETRKLLQLVPKSPKPAAPAAEAKKPAFVAAKGGQNRVTRGGSPKTLQGEVASLFGL